MSTTIRRLFTRDEISIILTREAVRERQAHPEPGSRIGVDTMWSWTAAVFIPPESVRLDSCRVEIMLNDCPV